MSDFENYTDEELHGAIFELQEEVNRRNKRLKEKEQEKDLEARFREAVKEAYLKINKHVAAARKELDEAVKVSEEYGIPFYPDVSPLYQGFRPRSFYEKWREVLDREDDLAYELLEGIPQYEGWQHSMVC